MNTIKMIKDAEYVAEMLAAIFGAACATEAVFAGSEMLYKDMSALGTTTKEILNPTVYKAKTGSFKKSVKVRHSRITGNEMYVRVYTDVKPVNKKPLRISKGQIKGGK